MINVCKKSINGWRRGADYFGDSVTYTMWGLKKPPYSSSKAWGRSQWKIVTKGFKPAFINRKN